MREMGRKIFHDYWNSFRWSHFRKIYRKGAVAYLLWVAYMLSVPYITGSAVHSIWSYVIVMLYLISLVLNMSVVPIYLPKQMFLTPMSKDERYRYLRGMMCMKICVPVLTGMVVTILWTWFREAPVWIGATNFISGCSIILAGTITTWPGSIWYRNDLGDTTQPLKRIKDVRIKGLQAISTSELVISISMYLIGMVFIESDDFSALWVKIVFAIASAVQIILSGCVLRYLKPVVEIATDYEKTYAVDRMFRSESPSHE